MNDINIIKPLSQCIKLQVQRNNLQSLITN